MNDSFGNSGAQAQVWQLLCLKDLGILSKVTVVLCCSRPVLRDWHVTKQRIYVVYQSNVKECKKSGSVKITTDLLCHIHNPLLMQCCKNIY